jgi:hypothetical protein
MPQIFHRSANTLSKVSIVGVLLLAGGLIGLIMVFGRSSYVTRANEFIEQPLQFSHAHHVGDDGIDCRYCHGSHTLPRHVASEAEHERVQAPCSRDLQLLAAKQV